MYLVFTRMPGESYRGDVPLVDDDDDVLLNVLRCQLTY